MKVNKIPLREDLLSLSMSLSTLNYLGIQTAKEEVSQKLKAQISECKSWSSNIYFVSKDRNFRAGSPALTAAYVLEAISSHQ